MQNFANMVFFLWFETFSPEKKKSKYFLMLINIREMFDRLFYDASGKKKEGEDACPEERKRN